MIRDSKHEAAIPNPLLKPFEGLVGEWNTIGTHRLLPDTTLHGRTSFEWIEGGAFLMMRSEIEEEGIPSAIAIFGTDDAKNEIFMLYFDERGVSRKYEAALSGSTWSFTRNAPGFSQRFTGTWGEDSESFLGVWELSEDNLTWKHDLELRYTRVKTWPPDERADKDNGFLLME